MVLLNKFAIAAIGTLIKIEGPKPGCNIIFADE
jgi:hypothetical protein